MTSELAYVMAAEQIGKIEVPEARPVPARAGRRAAAHRLALPLARHLVHGHGRRARRRRDDLPLLHPRARAGAGPLRGAGRARACSTASTRWAASATTSRPAGRQQCRETVDLIEQRLDEYEAMLEGNPFFHDAHQGRGRDLARAGAGRRRQRAAAARLGRRASTSGAREPYSSYEDFDFTVPGGDRRRLLRALPGADGRVPRVDQDRRARCSTACPRGRSRRGPA